MLAYETTTSERPRAKKADHETAIRMAELFIGNDRRGYPTTLEDLQVEFSDEEITLHTSAARRICRASTADRDVSETKAEYDRAARVAQGARIMADEIRNGEGVVFVKLRNSGFATRELADLYTDMISHTCLLLAEQGYQPPAKAGAR